MSGFDTTPKPEFLRALQAQKWKVAGALSELVDNAFGPGRGDATRCSITYDAARQVLTVLDNGKGMDGVGRLFQLGNTIGRAPGDIGIYGSGGTMAILWLASRVRVWTLRNGELNHDVVDWAEQIAKGEFPIVSDDWERATLVNTPEELLANRHGTMIEVRLLRERKFVISNVQRDLAETYAPAFRKGRALWWKSLGKNGQTQRLADPLEEPSDPASTIEFDAGLVVNDEFLGVRGKIGIVDDLPLSRSKVAIGYGPRVILRTRDCYRSPDGTEAFREAGVAGYIDLLDGWQPYLATTKDAFNDGPVWDALMEYVFQKIRPILHAAKRNELMLLLEDIAISLQVRSGHDVTDGRPAGTGKGPTPGEGHAEIKIDPTNGPEVRGKTPAGATFRIVTMTDGEMEGLLCKAQASGDGVDLIVNEDHPFTQAALAERPYNRPALELLVTRELADELWRNETLRQKTFRRADLLAIDDFVGKTDHESDGAAFIHRLLIDRVRRPGRPDDSDQDVA